MSLVIENLAVSHSNAQILSGISLSVSTGERFAIMGASGAGKSTLLRAIAGLAPLDSGTITIGSADVTSLPAHKRSVGLMFQDFALFPHLSVLENVVYGLRMAGVGTQERDRRGEELLDLVGLGGFGSRSTETLSGGEQQRTALARTLAPSPSVVLLDEPLGSLDESLKATLLDETRTVLASVGATSIYVTHDPNEAFAFCDRMAILNHGTLIRTDTPENIWSNPVSEFVARSIGRTNIVPLAALQQDGEGVCIVPFEAITIHQRGRVSGVMEKAIFHDGRYTCTIRLDGPGITLNAQLHRPPDIGQQLVLDVDPDQLIVLSTNKV